MFLPRNAWRQATYPEHLNCGFIVSSAVRLVSRVGEFDTAASAEILADLTCRPAIVYHAKSHFTGAAVSGSAQALSSGKKEISARSAGLVMKKQPQRNSASRENSAPLNNDFRATCQQIESLLAARQADKVWPSYQIGELLNETRKNGKGVYRKQIVKKFAESLECSEKTLYQCAQVAEIWTAAEMTALLQRKNLRGKSLSWSLLTVLAEVKTKSQREELIKKTLHEGLSVRKLHDLITNQQEPSDITAESRRRVGKVQRSCSRLSDQQEELLEYLETTGVPRQDGATRQETRDAIDELAVALENWKNQFDHLKSLLDLLESSSGGK